MLDIEDIDAMVDPDGEIPQPTNNYSITEESTKRKFGVGEK